MDRKIMVAVVVAGMVGGSMTAVASKQADPPTHPAALAALRYFESVQDGDFDGFLRQLRQPAPPPAIRGIEIARLPKKGEVTPTADQAAKLAAIRPLLAFHGREHDMELRLFTDGKVAFVGLHARTVLLISREALDLFDRDELMAIMAHELGHDYVWDVFEQARQQEDHRLLQELELRCDVIAVIAMGRVGVDAERLVSALTRLSRYGQRGRKTANEMRYVPMDQRVRFIRTVAGRIASVFESGPAAINASSKRGTSRDRRQCCP
jgi:Zn-dependent protease with chaperone function